MSRNTMESATQYSTKQTVYTTHKSNEVTMNGGDMSTLEEKQRTYSLMNAKPDEKSHRSFSFVRTPSLRKAKKENIDDDDDDIKIDTFSVGAIINETVSYIGYGDPY